MHMLELLDKAERELPQLLDAPGWHSMHITYQPPEVERAWRQWGPYRINLHRIMPNGRALFHPHPWPSAVRLLSGTYFMVVGYGPGVIAPPRMMGIAIEEGSFYCMEDRDGWHAVSAIAEPCLSLMVTGQPWEREMPECKHPPQGPLAADRLEQLLADFRAIYQEASSASPTPAITPPAISNFLGGGIGFGASLGVGAGFSSAMCDSSSAAQSSDIDAGLARSSKLQPDP